MSKVNNNSFSKN